jgi:hypothetical protein
MLQFDAAPVVTSIPFFVKGKEVFSRSRESSAWTLAGGSNGAQWAALVKQAPSPRDRSPMRRRGG